MAKESKDEWRGDTPAGLRRFACQFITVGRDALDCNRKRDPPVQWLPEIAPEAIYYNFLHGIELGLKAYILQFGAATIGSLRRNFGHDLEHLLREACDCGLRQRCPRLSDEHTEAIRASSSLYKGKEFEYIRIGAVQQLPIGVVAKAAETLLADLLELEMRPAQHREDAAISNTRP